jgi:hypothetical protein
MDTACVKKVSRRAKSHILDHTKNIVLHPHILTMISSWELLGNSTCPLNAGSCSLRDTQTQPCVCRLLLVVSCPPWWEGEKERRGITVLFFSKLLLNGDNEERHIATRHDYTLFIFEQTVPRCPPYPSLFSGQSIRHL